MLLYGSHPDLYTNLEFPMKAYVYGPNGAEITDVGKPSPKGSQVLVRVRASALNRADLLQRRGRYPAPPGVPADRLNLMRTAFMALFQDPRFLAEAKTSGISVDPRSGELIETLARELRAMPPRIVEAAKAAAE